MNILGKIFTWWDGATIGTSNPLTSVAVDGNAVTEDQDFRFDAAEADLSITKFAAAVSTAARAGSIASMNPTQSAAPTPAPI